jgi:titin
METPRTVPQPPLSISATPFNQALRVQWAGNGANDGGYPIIGYKLQYKPVTVSPADWVDIDLSGIYITNRDIMNLNNGITYNLRVFRRNAIGLSSPSSEIMGIPGTVSGPPTNLFLSPGPQHIDAYWQAPVDVGTNDVEYYYIQYKLTSAADSEYVYLKNTAGTAPKQITEFSTVPNAPGYDGYVASIINISNGLSYSVRVAAVTRVGLGAWSMPYISIPGTVPSQIE